MNIRDIAGAIGILQEAGGVMYGKDGLEVDVQRMSGKSQLVIFANNRQIAEQLLDLV